MTDAMLGRAATRTGQSVESGHNGALTSSSTGVSFYDHDDNRVAAMTRKKGLQQLSSTGT